MKVCNVFSNVLEFKNIFKNHDYIDSGISFKKRVNFYLKKINLRCEMFIGCVFNMIINDFDVIGLNLTSGDLINGNSFFILRGDYNDWSI